MLQFRNAVQVIKTGEYFDFKVGLLKKFELFLMHDLKAVYGSTKNQAQMQVKLPQHCIFTYPHLDCCRQLLIGLSYNGC